MLLLFSFVFAGLVYNHCISHYGVNEYIQVYDGYGDIQHTINARQFKCSYTGSFLFDEFNKFIKVAKNTQERITFLNRLSHFAIKPIENSLIDLTINNKTHSFKTGESGQVQITSLQPPHLVSSADSNATSYTLDKPILIISDIDDTIKIANVSQPWEAIRRLFISPFEPFQDVLFKYKQWQSNASFVYLSAGFKQSYSFLKPDLELYFPPGPLILRKFGKETTFDYKFRMATQLLTTTASSRVVLIGDATQKDAFVYAALYKRYPHRICKIYIRLISNAKQQLQAVVHALNQVPQDMVQFFTDAAILPNTINC